MVRSIALQLYKVIILLTCLTTSVSGYSQGFFEFSGSHKREAIPFSYHRNLIIIPVYINDHGPYHFILDTGVNFLILTNPDLKKELGITIGKTITIRGLGEGNDIHAGILSDLDLAIGNIKGRHFTAAIFPEDLMPFSSYVGMQVDGIIGNDLFRQFTICIDYSRQMMVIHKTNTWKPGKRFESHDLDIMNQRPYIVIPATLTTGVDVFLRMIVDTGAGHPLSLEAGSMPQLVLPPGALPARIGVGLNGPIQGVLSRVPLLGIGNTHLQNVICSYPIYTGTQINRPDDGRNGNIGNGILDHYQVVFDYVNEKIWFKKSNRLHKPFEYDMSGLDLISGGAEFRNYIVSGVDPGSPAAEAGLKEQDIILFIDLVPANAISITDIDNMLRSGNGKKLHVVYQRRGKVVMTTLVLQRRV